MDSLTSQMHPYSVQALHKSLRTELSQ